MSSSTTDRIPEGRALSLPALAMWAGLLAGAAELVAISLRRLVLHQFLFVGGDVWWTVPLVDVLLFLAVALVLLLGRLVWWRGPWWKIGLWIFAFLGVIGVLYNYPELHRVAAILLAAGVATQIVRSAALREAGFGRVVRRTLPWLMVLAVGTAAFIRGRVAWKEHRALASLGTATRGAPNVLLIVLDTVRAMDLSLFGYDRPTTPVLARWAKGGVLYHRAFATAPWTLLSHAAMLTGRLTHELSADWMKPLDNRYPTLAEVLATRGYATAGFAANIDYVSAEVGLARGFAHFDDYSLTPGLILRSAALGRAIGRNPLVLGIVGHNRLLGRKNAPDISAAFLHWTGRHSDRPWFAFLNYYDAHRPYQPPEPYYHMFASGGVDPDPRYRQDDDPAHPWTPADARRFIVAYDGAIAYLDAELGRLLAELGHRGELERTLVVITADHGEEFGEHRLFDHGHSLYLASLEVPLMMLLPGRIPAGLEVQEPVSLRDLPATILEYAGGAGASPFPGRSLGRFWRPGGPGAPDTVVSGVRRVERQPAWYPASRGDLISLAADSLRYIRNLGDGGEELYNYSADPAERRELSRTEGGKPALERFRATVAALLAKTSKGANQSQ